MNARAYLVIGLLAVASGCTPPPAPPPATPLPPPTPTSRAAEAVATLQTGPSATVRAVAAATSVAASPVKISEVVLNTVNFGDWSVTLSNVGVEPVDLSGWTLLVGAYRTTLPHNQFMTLMPTHSKTVHFRGAVPASPPSGEDIYVTQSGIESGASALTQDGDRVVLLDPTAQVASVYQLP